MGPSYYHCQTGILGFHWSTLAIVGVLSAVLYYGWSFIEAILILLPIPDPKGLTDGIKHYFG